MPPVGVLIPAYNAAETLPRVLRDTLAQGFSDVEVLVVDDGSQDGTGAILSEVASRDPRVRTLTLPQNRGIVAALNAGLSAFSVDVQLVARMDADDRMLPGRLAAQVAAFSASPTLTVLGGQVRLSPADSPMAPYVDWLNALLSPTAVAQDIYVESPLCHPSVMFRRRAVAAIGGYRAMPWTEDWDLWLRLHQAQAQLSNLPQFVVEWRDHPGRLTRTDSRCSVDALRRCRAHFLARWLGGRACQIWGAGRDGKRLGRALETEGVFLEAFIDIDPRKVGRTRRGRPVLPPSGLISGVPLIAAVGVRGARAQIRAYLAQQGWRDGVDFVCAA